MKMGMIILLVVWILGMSYLGIKCSDEINSRGLKSLINEVWEGKPVAEE